MKNAILKIALTVVAISSFIMLQSCNQSGNNEEHTHSTEQHDHALDEMHEDDHAHGHDGDVSHMLTLNNGSKWQDDEPTKKNANNLISIGEKFSKNTDKTLEDYHTFGNDIQSGINTMIKECTMEGEADQALHYWFAPLLSQAGTIKKATDINGLSNVTSEMIHRLNEYHDYFE